MVLMVLHKGSDPHWSMGILPIAGVCPLPGLATSFLDLSLQRVPLCYTQGFFPRSTCCLLAFTCFQRCSLSASALGVLSVMRLQR